MWRCWPPRGKRVDNNDDTERAIVRRELTRIVDRRLTVLLDSWSPIVTLSTHVLDTANGEPVAGLRVRLDREHDGTFAEIAAGVTNTDGRLSDWVDPNSGWPAPIAWCSTRPPGPVSSRRCRLSSWSPSRRATTTCHCC